jgi:DNA sulfur modification protein DndD
MILQQLALRNFGLFGGKQAFDLAPVVRNGKSRPVILFGGINGGGKTTLFDAIQLALYGSRARCSKRLSLSYSDFLLQSIHHGVNPAEGASVALAFRYAADGEEHDYEVRRSWQVRDNAVRESLLVFQDGLPNQTLSSNWPQLVEELIPLEIAQLFFFDGEKIRSLAEDASSSATLGAAIKALLGLDLVERLIADTTVLQTRLAKQSGTAEHQAHAATLEGATEQLQAECDRLHSERAALENHLQRAINARREAEETFAAVGGRHWEARQERRQRLAELTTLAGELEAQLVSLAAGDLPLALVPDLLARVHEQDTREQRAAEAQTIYRLLVERDRRLLEVLERAEVPSRWCTLVAEYLEADRRIRQPSEGLALRLGLSESARSLLRHLREHRLGDGVEEVRQLLDKLEGIHREREDVQRALAAIPAEEDMVQVMARLTAATQETALLEEQARRLDTALDSQKAELKDCQTRLERLWQGQVEQEFAREDAARMVQLAGRTRQTMQEFLRRATAQKIDQLSALITESFRYLLRKQTLVERILIDPETFAITLYDAAGQALARQRLSEGEKQIFAVSMLWGLARAAARPLPAVIDTPMARLDAVHCQNLVERYLPHASHQVILLSTDTEVDRHYYALLQPFLARAYHLNYDEESKVTVGEAGYFWKE